MSVVMWYIPKIVAALDSGMSQLLYETCVVLTTGESTSLVFSSRSYNGRPPLLSSCQSSCLQIQPALPDFWEVVELERGPLSLVRIIEELLEWKSAAPV
jgi:hypothetical protein